MQPIVIDLIAAIVPEKLSSIFPASALRNDCCSFTS